MLRFFQVTKLRKEFAVKAVFQVTQLLARLTVHYKLNSAAIIIQNSSEWRSIFESFERQALAFNITTVNKYFFNDNEKCCKWQSPCCGSPWSYDIYKDAGSLTKGKNNIGMH